ncbi:MAG: hypothetical protein RSD68_06765 [Oscillospiraceae bacterium]
MKKLLSLILTLCLAISLLPGGALAAASGEDELYFCYALYSKEHPNLPMNKSQVYPLKEYNSSPKSSTGIIFYTDAQGTMLPNNLSVTITNDSLLSVTSKATEAKEPGYFEIESKGAEGNCSLTFSWDAGKSKTIPANISLPNEAFYTAPQRSVENYCGSTLEHKPNESTKFYLMKPGGYTEQEAKAVTNSNSDDMKPLINGPTITADKTAVGFYLEYSIKPEITEEFNFYIKTSTGGAGIQIYTADVPRLMIRAMKYVGYGKYVEDPTQALQSGIKLSPEFPRFVEFFYGTKTQNDKVDIKNLTFPNFVYCEFDPQGKYVKIGDAGFGNGEIKYASADGTTSAAMSIRVILPTVGTFKEQARTKENYIGIRCYYNSGDTSVYFMQSGGFTPKEKEAVKVNSGGDFVTLTWLANATNPSNFDLKLSVNKDSKYNFDFDIEGIRFRSRIQFVRAKSEYLIDCKFETDKWIRSDASNVALKQGFEDNFRSIQVRFYKGGKIVLPSKIVIDEPSAPFVTISEPTADGIYTISCSKLIKFSTIATLMAT